MEIFDPATISSTEEILSSFKKGEIKRLSGELVFKEFVRSWNIDKFNNELGDSKISRHTDFDGEIFKPSWQTLSSLCTDLKNCNSIPIPGSPDRMFLYGVTNSKRIDPKSPIKSGILDHFSQSFSFVWVGLSPGLPHCDYYNNILCQVSGTKLITVYPPSCSDVISRNHFVPLVDKTNIHAPENIAKYPGLDNPCVRVLLGPGDAILIPCASYHAPQAMSVDSISINAFFTPRSRDSYLNKFSRKEDKYPWWYTNASIALSKKSFNFFGRPTLRAGHYEVM